MNKLFFKIQDTYDSNGITIQTEEALDFITNQAKDMTEQELKEHQWTITPVFMTQEEFEALPEYEF